MAAEEITFHLIELRTGRHTNEPSDKNLMVLTYLFASMESYAVCSASYHKDFIFDHFRVFSEKIYKYI